MTVLSSIGNLSVGKKFIVAVTGLGMVGFLVAHLIGNLLIFEGAEAMNQYAELIRFDPVILWGLRAGLILMVVLHVVFTVRLTRENRAARPVGYAAMSTQKASGGSPKRRRAASCPARSVGWNASVSTPLGMRRIRDAKRPSSRKLASTPGKR